ncbi:histidine kinase dimerization/phospho-acceptor domain-containing protein [Gilvimarinus sp. SDUM040013]|uniref:histidine kinase n=1 Tax=Gilvimarinus gilvus TaxID=3058038 RepID=A0ABU4S052_9GAMM|nr:histidine kinase dimerization/phospho-acceptor domain-containing protein [Gilvimarinus sp. SDUM040013]MDO3388509.1 histidine kinase dimerization/phospho-acceptor domain-containing protein [Gilvimarinus sp. SDUM040013]MDX6848619.1 histidine kinase dimerization/phospho-acceptor domain-containing protein [Gilvimarinus sp. SDUM040013]
MTDDLRKIVHDARNPLNNISVNAELGKLSLESLDDKARAIEVLDTIVRECKRCSDVLDTLTEAIAQSEQEER